jgi:hypothetical protein
LEGIGIKSDRAELNPSVGVLANHVYNLPALFPFGKFEIFPFRHLCAFAIAEVNLRALKVSQGRLLPI